jgi:hypothetical protein
VSAQTRKKKPPRRAARRASIERVRFETRKQLCHAHAACFPTKPPPKNKGYIGTDFLENVMDGYGAPYTVLRVAGGENFTELLWAPDGTARYAGYVM